MKKLFLVTTVFLMCCIQNLKAGPLLLVVKSSITAKPCGTQFKLNNFSYNFYFNNPSKKLKVWYRKTGTTTWSYKIATGGTNQINLGICTGNTAGYENIPAGNYEMVLTNISCSNPEGTCSVGSPKYNFTTIACCCNCPIP